MMCAQLKALADAAEPTAVHRLMKEMEQAGKLFRVYTQVRLPLTRMPPYAYLRLMIGLD